MPPGAYAEEVFCRQRGPEGRSRRSRVGTCIPSSWQDGQPELGAPGKVSGINIRHALWASRGDEEDPTAMHQPLVETTSVANPVCV